MIIEDEALHAYINEVKEDFTKIVDIFLIKKRDTHIEEFHFNGFSFKIFIDLLGREADFCYVAFSAQKKASLTYSVILSYKITNQGVDYCDFWQQ